jgi:ABC-type transport system involved in cytochrome bd biosynthesis fused ATPase/permease subunit
MKEGSIVEQGTHNELLEQAGEYAKMYNIQAQAFSEVSDRTRLLLCFIA